MSKEPSIKILVGYHKPAVLLKDDVLTPIHLGRALATKASKDGAMSKEDYQWMLDNMIGDDTGDNISHLNREFCELSGIYWAWKNYDKLGNPDYIGFMHYRRLFAVGKEKDENIFTTPNSSYAEDLKKTLLNLLPDADLIIPVPHDVKDIKSSVDIYEQYAKYNFHYPDGLHLLRNAIERKYPGLLPDFDEYFNQRQAYFTTMFIMSRKDFFEYSEITFNILFKLQSLFNLSKASLMEQRAVAYIGEYFTGMYLYHLQKIRKFKQIPRYFIIHPELNKALCPAFSQNNIAMFCSTDDNYAAYCGVLLKSVIENGSPENNYDIVVLEEKLSAANKSKLISLAENHPNVSIRFYNVAHLMGNKSFHLCAHFTIATYYRMFVASVFQNYSKIIYLDIDTIVLEDIAELYRTDMSDRLIAAVRDYGVMAKIKSGRYEPVEYFQEKIGVQDPFSEYFQAGVLVFNISEMKRRNIEEKLIKTAQENKFYYVDQDVLNKVCYGRVVFLDSAWNTVTDAGRKRGMLPLIPAKFYLQWQEDRKHPKIIHYCSNEKPWNAPYSDLTEYWWRYARMTSFYEEILYKNIRRSLVPDISAQIKGLADMQTVREAVNYGRSRLKYYRYKLLSKITFGKMRKHYRKKRKDLKARLKQIRAFLKGK